MLKTHCYPLMWSNNVFSWIKNTVDEHWLKIKGSYRKTWIEKYE